MYTNTKLPKFSVPIFNFITRVLTFMSEKLMRNEICRIEQIVQKHSQTNTHTHTHSTNLYDANRKSRFWNELGTT